MTRMCRLGHFRSLLGPTLLLSLTASCSRPTPAVPTENIPSATPFEDRPHDSSQGSPQSAALLERNFVGSDLPFGSTETLPPGTLLTVRLKSPLTAQNGGSNATFEAIVDDAVVVDGNTLIPKGTVASGRVGAVRISNLQPDRGYVRLTLESLSMDGRSLPLQTANLFARQTFGDLRSGSIHLEKGRQLTFHLTEAFHAEAEAVRTSH